MELNSKPFSLLRVMHASLQMQRARAEERGVGLHLEVCEQVPFGVEADELRIKQCIINYLSCVQCDPRGRGPAGLGASGTAMHQGWTAWPASSHILPLTLPPANQQRAQVHQGWRRPAASPALPLGSERRAATLVEHAPPAI